jgi:hypothetical protein
MSSSEQLGIVRADKGRLKLITVALWKRGDSAVGIATGLTTKGSEFESRWGQEFSLLHVVQTGSGAHPASYPMGTGGSFPEGKVAGA